MITKNIRVNNIPAIIWGRASEDVYIFVHGKFSNKEAAEGFAEIAVRKELQVISFDLPEHGERENEGETCTVQNGVRDLAVIGDYARKHWQHVRVFACSLGAYFSLLAYRDFPCCKYLFLSPILDMQRLIHNMMKQSNVTEKQLYKQQEIPTVMGEILSWSYYRYVVEHPVVKWDTPTHILYGEHDHLTEKETLDKFVDAFAATVDIVADGEHHFYTDEHTKALSSWLERNI